MREAKGDKEKGCEPGALYRDSGRAARVSGLAAVVPRLPAPNSPNRYLQAPARALSQRVRTAPRSARLAFFAARFSSSVFAGLRFCSRFWFMPLLMCAISFRVEDIRVLSMPPPRPGEAEALYIC